MKKLSIQNTILFLALIFILASAFSENGVRATSTNDLFFPNNPTVSGPGFFPFSNSQGAVDAFGTCSTPDFFFDGPPGLSGSTLEVGPAANGFETGSRQILVFDMDGNLSVEFTSAFPLSNPSTMVAFDPSMGDILGLSFVPGPGFPSGSTVLMITTTFNCDDGMTTSSTSTSGTATTSSGSTVATSSGSTAGSSSGAASSSGVVLTDGQVIASAISNEKDAKKLINIKTLLMGGNFSVSMALDELMSSVSDLQDLSNRLSDSTAMIGMGTIQSAVDDVISSDNEVIMTLEPFKNTDPSVTNGELTTALTKANMILNEAIMIKERIEAKIKKSEK